MIQLNDADIHTVSQPTVSRVISQVSSAIFEQQTIRQFIEFPTSVEQLHRNKVCRIRPNNKSLMD